MIIRIATRESKLAIIQTNLVIQEIAKYFPEIKCEIVPIATTGDKILNKNLYDLGGKALFLKELEEKLLTDEVDIAVHSLKDVPGIVTEELEIIAVLEREDPKDCFVSFKYKSLNALPQGAIIGTSSVRRKVLLHQTRPDLLIIENRGNVQTRINKLKNGIHNMDATILACAGLKRLGLFDAQYCFPIEPEQMIPSAGQGVIAIQKRKNDFKLNAICNKINHSKTWILSQAERGFLTYFDASCRTPISAYAQYIDRETIKADYMYGDFEGKNLHFTTKIGHKNYAPDMGLAAAKEIENNYLKRQI